MVTEKATCVEEPKLGGRKMKAAGLAMVLIMPCSSGTSISRTYYVSPTGSGTYPFTTPESAATVIQDAVDDAECGDVVQLMPGEYRQRVVLKPGLHFWGSGANSTTILIWEEGWGSVGVTGAEGAEIRGVRIAREPGGLGTDVCGVRLYGDQVVAECAMDDLGIGFSGASATGPAFIYACTFDGPRGGVGVGLSASLILDSCRFSGTAVGAGGLVLLTRCTFAAALLLVGEGDVVVDSCIFGDAGGYSSWIDLEGRGSLRMVNCIMWGRVADIVANIAENVEIYNSTFVNDDHAIFCDSAVKIVLRNSILWGPPGQLDGVDPASFDVEYSDVAGGWEGEGNIDADPMFVDPDSGDFRLRPESPCIDAGYGPLGGWPPWVPGADFAGRPRAMYGGARWDGWRRADMGAFEYYINRVSPGPLPRQTTLTWSCTYEETYSVFYSDDLLTWHLAQGNLGPGYNSPLLSWIDDGSKTGVPPSLVPRRFYRILENP
jgi:hypothetical protein